MKQVSLKIPDLVSAIHSLCQPVSLRARLYVLVQAFFFLSFCEYPSLKHRSALKFIASIKLAEFCRGIESLVDTMQTLTRFMIYGPRCS